MRTDHLEERSTFERVFDALLICAAMLAVASIAWGLDTQDITVEWTPEGKQIAMERAANWPARDEMVPVPAGSFLMGSDRRVDRNAYLFEFPQRRVHLDAFEIDKYEVTALQYLKFILATGRLVSDGERQESGPERVPVRIAAAPRASRCLRD